ncbi:uncharacterized protein STEHIDRAFT_138309 [Stereum hirsutum FP-91666 SS1]|uniref:uncharacterized protein n=1 Tax=Stereum hirsutum (strain FP-91666) TaxID=721885 RepID=UPI000440CABC|nr:uncharacterized protein STEHIDRAFT_138309 [Stereum hirsutum FP-91666 SS1]EIM89343.1 hypothetical protein STEHIDRAFT_138309 [Stereum hirsutum FP-91666 SS1]
MSHHSRGNILSGFLPVHHNVQLESESRPVQTAGQPEPQRAPKRRALLIGIRYKGNREYGVLPGTYDGVDAFWTLLVDKLKYQPDDITIMKDDPETKDSLQPTEVNIRWELQALVEGAMPKDRFTLLYCGHSRQIPVEEKGDHHEEDNMNEAIITSDTQDIIDNARCVVVYVYWAVFILILPIHFQDLKRILVDSLPTGSHLTAIFDCCHSGTLLDLPHYHCNNVWVPWISKGERRTKSRMNYLVKGMDVFYAKISDLVPTALRFPNRANATSPQHSPPLPSPHWSSHGRPLSPAARPTRSPPPTPSSHSHWLRPRSPPVLVPAASASRNISGSPDPTPPLRKRAAVAPDSSTTPFAQSPNSENVDSDINSTTRKPPIRKPVARGTHPPASPHPIRSLMHQVNVDPSIMIPAVDWKVPDLGTRVPQLHSHCESPGSEYDCDGWCRESWGRGTGGKSPDGGEKPTVISLGSCSDPQLTWETPEGKSMTQFICQYLSKFEDGTSPTYRELMMHLNYTLHDLGLNLHTWTRGRRDELRNQSKTHTRSQGKNKTKVKRKRDQEDPEDNRGEGSPGEINNFQSPCLSSLSMLDMDTPFLL